MRSGRRGLLPAVVVLVAMAAAGVVPGQADAAPTPPPAGVTAPQTGAVVAWGRNHSGQLGDGTTTRRPLPVPVHGLSDGVVQVATTGEHSIAVRADGTAWSWGVNDEGVLGDGTTIDRLSPVPVVGLTGVVQVAAGGRHTAALRSDGTVWTWGSNKLGQLGTGAESPGRRSVPGRVSSLAGVVQIVAHASHTLALLSDGTVWAWGENDNGQLGDGTKEVDRFAPVKVGNLPPVVQVATGSYHSLALTVDRQVFAWGRNELGQLGNGEVSPVRLSPVPVLGLSQVKQLAAGQDHSAALKLDGTVSTWGSNVSRQLGDPALPATPNYRSVPGPVPGLTGVTSISAGPHHNLVVRSGELWAWGRDEALLAPPGPATTYVTLPRPTLIPHMKGAVATASDYGVFMVVVTAAPDFTVSLDPDHALIRAGQSTMTTISSVPVNGHPPVQAAVSGLPFGVTASLSSSTLADGAAATLSLHSTAMALSGTHNVTITAGAKTFTFVLAVTDGSELGCSNTNHADVPIPDNGPAVASAMPLVGCDLTRTPTEAAVEVHIVHPRRGDLVVELVEPNGTSHQLRAADPTDASPDVHETYQIELAAGSGLAAAALPANQWQLRVRDVATGSTGIVDNWTLTL